MIAVAGLALNNSFVRALGGAVLALSFVRLTLVDATAGPRFSSMDPDCSDLPPAYSS